MGNSYIESKMLIWILMFFLIQVADTLDKFSDKDTITNYCALCGCYKTEETPHTLSCKKNEVIRMELSGDLIKSRPSNHAPSSCVLTKEGHCKSVFSDSYLVTTYTDRVTVYKLCTLQNTCTFTVKSVAKGKVKVVRYPYVCEKNIISMSNPVSLQVTNPVLYFTGKDHVGENIDCGCTVTPSDQQTMELDIFYITGDNMCNGVTFNSVHIFQCTNNIQLYTRKIPILNQYLQFEIRNITATGENVLFFKVHGSDLNVTCTHGSQEEDPVVKSTTSPNSKTSENSLGKESNITITSMTTTQSNQQSDMTGLGFISQAEHDEKLKANNVMFGGIIAAILIAALLGIGIFCFIRRRNTTDKLSNAPNQPVSTNTQYAHADYDNVGFHSDTESSHYQELNMYLTVTG